MFLDRPKHDETRGHAVVGIRHTGTAAEQNFSRRLVLRGAAEGWLRMDGATLVIHGDPEDLVYTIDRTPGYYVKSTGERIPLSELAASEFFSSSTPALAAAEARAFLAGKGLPATDYEATLAYHCTLAPEQQAKFRAVRDIAGNVVAAHTLES